MTIATTTANNQSAATETKATDLKDYDCAIRDMEFIALSKKNRTRIDWRIRILYQARDLAAMERGLDIASCE